MGVLRAGVELEIHIESIDSTNKIFSINQSMSLNLHHLLLMSSVQYGNVTLDTKKKLTEPNFLVQGHLFEHLF